METDYGIHILRMILFFLCIKVHTATCDGGLFGGGEISSLGEPGEWAIAYCRAGISGRKTYYNHF